MAVQNSIPLRTTARLRRILPARIQRKSLAIGGLLFVNTMLELFGLATLVPVFSAVVEQDARELSWLAPVYGLVAPMSARGFVLLLVVVSFLAFVGKNIAVLLIARSLSRFSFSIYEHFAVQAHRNLFGLGLEVLRRNTSHEVARNINVSTRQFSQLLLLPLLMFWNEVILVIIMAVLILVVEPIGALLLAAVIGPACALFYRGVRSRIAFIGRELHDYSATLNRELYNSVYGFVDVALSGTEEQFHGRFKRGVKDVSRLSVDNHVIGLAPSRVSEVAAIAGISALVLYGIWALEDRSEVAFVMGLFAIAAYRLLPSVNRILSSILAMRRHEHLFDVVEDISAWSERIPDVPDHEGLVFEDEFSARNLSFKFEGSDKYALRDVTIKVERGESIGLVGQSGSGKTTLLNIFLRFLVESSGGVYVDGTKLDDTNRRAWRALIGYVPQDVFLIEGTIEENIAFGRNNVSRSQMERAIDQASLRELVQSLPNGIQSPIGEQGAQLSGGQRQRIAIARALYAGAEVVFFDEATSALDPDTEREITHAMRDLASEGVTIVVVAHRISTLRYCDRVVSLANGEVIDVTTYDELSKHYSDRDAQELGPHL